MEFAYLNLRGFIAYLAPCSRLYQLNLLHSYYCYVSIYNASAVVNNAVPGNSLQRVKHDGNKRTVAT